MARLIFKMYHMSMITLTENDTMMANALMVKDSALIFTMVDHV